MSAIIQFMSKKKHKQHNPGQVIFPANHPNPPQQHEIDVAYILARYYRTTVEFLIPIDDFKRKSADIKMFGIQWEIKSPVGGSKSTIQNQFRRGAKQSKNIILDVRRTKLKYEIAQKRVRFELQKHPHLNKIILVENLKNFVNVVEIQN